MREGGARGEELERRKQAREREREGGRNRKGVNSADACAAR